MKVPSFIIIIIRTSQDMYVHMFYSYSYLIIASFVHMYLHILIYEISFLCKCHFSGILTDLDCP